MTNVLTPVLSAQPHHAQTSSAEIQASLEAVEPQDTKEYLADMLKELSAIAGWADLHRAQTFIDAALRELDAAKEQ
jgi:hypothetical protein